MTTDRVFAKHRTVSIPGHKDKVYTLGWNCLGDRLATGSWDSTIRVYQLDAAGNVGKSGEQLVSYAHHDKHYCEQLAWSGRQESVLATITSDKLVRTWDVRSRQCIGKVKLNGLGQTIAWHPEGNVLAVGLANDAIALYDVRSSGSIKADVLRQIDKVGEVNEIAFTLDGRFLLQGSSGFLQVYQYEPWQATCKLQAHNGPVWAVAIDPTGRQLATGGGDGITCVWERESLLCTHVLSTKDWPNMSVDFSHDGQFIAVGSNEDYTIEIHDAWGGGVVHTISLSRPTDSIKWNPKHLILASTGEYGRDKDGTTLLFSSGA